MGTADPAFDDYIARYGNDVQRAAEGLAADRWWAQYIHAHEPNAGWRAWARTVLAADPAWTSGRHRGCECGDYADQHRRERRRRPA